eukprot:7367159-Prymnesium_polylepis.1
MTSTAGVRQRCLDRAKTLGAQGVADGAPLEAWRAGAGLGGARTTTAPCRARGLIDDAGSHSAEPAPQQA